MTTAFSPRMVAPGEGKTVMLFGVRFSYKVESAHSGGSLTVLEVQIPAKTLVKPHSHSREDEFSLVLEGTVGVRVADRVLEAGPGAYLVKPRGIPHAMWNAANTPARVAEILCRAVWSPTSRSWRPSWVSTALRRSTTSSPSATGSPSKTTGSRTWKPPTASSSDRTPR